VLTLTQTQKVPSMRPMMSVKLLTMNTCAMAGFGSLSIQDFSRSQGRVNHQYRA